MQRSRGLKTKTRAGMAIVMDSWCKRNRARAQN